MVQTESEVEGRIAEPGDLGVKEHGSRGADEDILRADVAMDEDIFCLRGRVGQSFKARCKIGIPTRRFPEIRVEPQCLEMRVGGEARRVSGIAGSCRMEAAGALARR